MRNERPLISFTFDDFPRTALHTAGPILESKGARGTYYVSLGLLGRTTSTGELCNADDIRRLLGQGHELGCHTYDHCHATTTPALLFQQSIGANAVALNELSPGASFRTLSYPIGNPRPSIKRVASSRFRACRGGGQTYNARTVDLSLVAAFFLEQSRENLGPIKAMIDQACQENGWLVFATHDVTENPTRFGCEPAFFRAVVSLAAESMAEIVPVSAALNAIVAHS